MNDASFVRFFEVLGDLDSDIDSLVGGDRTSCDAFGKRLTLNELENEVVRALGVFQAVDGGDVRMVQ